MIPGVRIVKQEEHVDYSEDGVRTTKLRTIWKFGTHGPFYDDEPKNGWTAPAFEQRIRDHVAGLQSLGVQV